MNKKTLVLLLIATVLIIGIVKFVLFPSPKSSLSSPIGQSAEVKEAVPSETTKTYFDPTGFSFNYPDNLSIANNQTTDSASYADIKLTAAGVNGSLNLKIVDSKYKTLDAYFKANNITEVPKDVTLGTLKAQEVILADKITVIAIDQGILFTVDSSKNEFWNKVYSKVLKDFNFAAPVQDNTTSTGDDVSFEGEEVVE